MATALASVLLGGTPQAQTAKGDRIPLRLFAKGDIDRSKSCSVSLWQHNRNPDRDKFAAVFFEQISGRNYACRDAKIKIGSEAVRL